MSEKEKLQHQISEIFNSTGAYKGIVNKVKKELGIDLEKSDHIFNYIEECIVDMIFELE